MARKMPKPILYGLILNLLTLILYIFSNNAERRTFYVIFVISLMITTAISAIVGIIDIHRLTKRKAMAWCYTVVVMLICLAITYGIYVGAMASNG